MALKLVNLIGEIHKCGAELGMKIAFDKMENNVDEIIQKIKGKS